MDSLTATPCMVITTLPNRQQAEELAKLLLIERVAACIQMVDIHSSYLWQDKLCHEAEVLLLIKTTEETYSHLEQTILAHHPYELPEIIKIPINGGSANYLQWLSAITVSHKNEEKK